MKFSFTSLGCASALPIVGRFPSAHVLNIHERIFLIDCGEGCQMQLRKYGFSFLKINHIFISHLHGDHLFGLFGLLSSMSLLGRNGDLSIYAPEGFKDILAFYLKQFGVLNRYNINHIILKNKGLNKLIETKKYEILSFPLNHRVDCYGFMAREKKPEKNIHKEKIDQFRLSLNEIARLKKGEDILREDGSTLQNKILTYDPYKPRSFAYCSDTAPFSEIPRYLKNFDLIYHEATFASDMEKMAKETMHSTAKDAASFAKETNSKRLIIGHFSSRYRDLNTLLSEAKTLFPETYIAEEGKEFNIPLDKFV